MKLTKKSLLAWAKQKHPDEFVGYANVYDQCPLAMYLNETAPVLNERWLVSFARITRVFGTLLINQKEIYEKPTSPLMRAIVREVDKKPAWDTVTAAEFIAILEDL